MSISFESYFLVADEIDRIKGFDDLSERKAALDVLTANYPSHFRPWFYKAYVYEDLGDYHNAKIFYEKSIELGKRYHGSDSAYYNLALLLENNFQDFVNARLNYQNAITVNPNHRGAFNNLGMLIHNHFPDVVVARQYYLKGLQNNPNDSGLHHNIGYLLADVFEEYGLALHHFDRALELDPGNEDLIYNINLLREEFL